MMKTFKISAILLAVLIGASSCSHHRSGKSESWNGRQRMERFGMMHGMRHWNNPGYGWGGNFRRGPGFGMMQNRGFRQGMMGIGGLYNIPNLSDKQKKEIADLRSQQMEEMRKFREENMAKMQSMMQEHRNKVMSILTYEQKKYLEGENPSDTPSAKQ